MTEHDKLQDDSESAERARRRAKLPPIAPLVRSFVHVHGGISRKQRRAKAAEMAKAGVVPLAPNAKAVNV